MRHPKHPEARHGNTKERAALKRTGGVLSKSYTEIAGKTLSVSQRKIQRDIKLAGEIFDEASELLVKTSLANKPKELARLAKQDYETQLKLAEIIIAERTNDVKGAERILRLNMSSVDESSEKLHSKLTKTLLELMNANQQTLFQNAVDRSDPNLLSLVERINEINEITTNWLEYYQRNEPRLLDAA